MADNLAGALAAFQAELPRIGKGNTANTGTYSFRYADLADVAAVVLPLLGKHGLSFSARPTLDDGGRFVLAYELLHTNGDSRVGAYPLPASGTPQQIGSAITYARRYALCAVTGVAADEDDDGQAAATTHVRPAERHEHSYDAAEQEMLRDGYQQEIDAATTPEEIAEIGKRVRAKQRAGDLSPATFQHLSSYAARRRAELDQPAEEQPATVPADKPRTRRERELAAMDQAVAQRKESADAATA